MRYSPRTAAVMLITSIAIVVFWRTAYPTITWWDSSQYSIAAGTMGVTGAPGSLLLTLLGWPVAHLPLGASPAHRLNLLAAALAVLTTVIGYLVALRLLRMCGWDTVAATVGAALGALTFTFAATTWEYATKFSPYILTTVFTGLILGTLLRWWEEADHPESWRHLAMLGLLFGLDFSVHRTNSMLIPGALAWILFRRPQTLRESRVWIAGVGGLMAGLSTQLLLIPVARATHSPLIWNDPADLPRLWDYISLNRLGGGFLIDFLPRKSAFWSMQVGDLLRTLRDNFFHWTGTAGFLGMLPGVAGVIGLAALWRRNRRLGLAFTTLLVLQAAMTVLYFNIPANYFRSLDRHYLPVNVTCGVAIACGLGVVLRSLTQRTHARAAVAAASIVIALVPAVQLVSNWRSQDASRRYFALDYARNALGSLPPNTIYFTVGDNDTFPLIYAQALEGVRRDVQVVNLSVASLLEFGDEIRRLDPAFPLAMTTAQRRIASEAVWTDTTLIVPVAGTAEQLGLRAGSTVPPNVVFRPRASFGAIKMSPGDLTLVDIIRTNAWRRPIAMSITAGDLGWLTPYARLDGLYSRIVPVVSAPPELARLRTLLDKNEYRGYADSSVRLDDFAYNIGFVYHQAFSALLSAEKAAGAEGCRAAAERIIATIPPGRLRLPPELPTSLRARC